MSIETTAPLAKLVPFTVRMSAGPPAGVVGGDRLVMVGAEATVNSTTLEI